MENAKECTGDCITPEIKQILEKKLQRFRRKQAWALVGLIVEKGRIIRIRTEEDENIADLLIEPVAK